jgi:sulfate permease, SulP family
LTPIRSDPPGRLSHQDILAGLSVALILIPQSMAYAELAGLPSQHGLYAAGLPLVAAALFASSPYLQTGPVALTSLLTLGALVPLATTGSESYAAVAALLALVVGVTRILFGTLRMGWVTHLMSRTVMSGFLSAAAILILASQVPAALGTASPAASVLSRASWALTHHGSWETASVVLSLGTVVLVVGASKVHPLIPGALLAVVGGLLFSRVSAYTGPTVGRIPTGLPIPSLDLPWSRLPSLLVPGVVIAVVGFADAVSVSRLYATEAHQRWNADREFLGSGVANVVSCLVGGFPVGGGLARTTLNKVAGARSRWSGLVTGTTVLLFVCLPFASALRGLPRAVLSGIVIAAISNVIRPRELMALWRSSPSQAFIGWGTFAATLLLEPRVDRAVVVGVAMSALVHLWHERTPHISARREGDTLYVEPHGVLWFGSSPAMEDALLDRLAEEPDVKRVVVRCAGLGRIDLSGAHTLAEMLEQARATGLEMTLQDVPAHATRILAAVGLVDEYAGRGEMDAGTRPDRSS